MQRMRNMGIVAIWLVWACTTAGAQQECSICSEIDITQEPSALGMTRVDCNDNGIDDVCDIDCGPEGGECDVPGCGQSSDCNVNWIPDECDIADGTSEDCTDNGIPDECEPDCNENGSADSCDIDAVGLASSWAAYDAGYHGVGDDPDGY